MNEAVFKDNGSFCGIPGSSNELLDGGSFYVSYNPAPWLGDGPETALRFRDEEIDSNWYILNGDWRKDYERLVPQGWQACLDFFNSKKDKHLCSWSVLG